MAHDFRPLHDGKRGVSCSCALCVPSALPRPRPDDWKFQVKFRAFGDRGFGDEEFVDTLTDVRGFLDDLLVEAKKASSGFLVSVTPRGGTAETWKKIPSSKSDVREALPGLLAKVA